MSARRARSIYPSPVPGVPIPRPSLSRRQVLGIGLGAAAAGIVTAAFHGVGHLGRYPQVPFPAEILDGKTAAIFQALGDFLIPPGGPLPGSAGDLETLVLIDRFLADLPDHHRMLMLGLAHAFEHGTALERFGADRMTAMTPARRQAYLDGWATSPDLVRAQLWSASKMIYNMSYFERDDVQAAMGVPQLCGVLA